MNALVTDLVNALENRVEVYIPHNGRGPLPEWDGGTIRVYLPGNDTVSAVEPLSLRRMRSLGFRVGMGEGCSPPPEPPRFHLNITKIQEGNTYD